MGIGYTNTIETQIASNEIPFAPIPDVKFARDLRNGSIVAFFQDPKDVHIDGRLMTKREKTIIVAKKGAPPENHFDGEYVYTHTGYHDAQEWLEFISSYSDYDGAGAQLYVQFFAVSTSGNVYPITRVYKLYTYLYVVRIISDDPNPDTRVTSFGSEIAALHPATPAEWELVEPFKSIRPCLFKNGKVQYYLKKEDFTKKEDGSPSDIESGTDGDVMIEFPNVHVLIVNEVEEIVVISGIPLPPVKEFLSPLEGFDSLDNFYVSAYLGSEQDMELRSLVGEREVTKRSLSQAREMVQKKGSRYELLPLWVHAAIQALFILKYKTTNSEIIGYGKLYGLFDPIRPGETKSRPMDSGTTENTTQNIKLFGIEGVWGMDSAWLDGVIFDSPDMIKVKNERRGSAYNHFFSDAIGHPGHIKKVEGGKLGFLPTGETRGSESTYFCDYFSLRGTEENLRDYFVVGNKLNPGIVRSSGIFSGRNTWENSDEAIRFVYY